MADNHKYYYLRLKEDFFDDDAIQIIESMPDGYMYSNILLKLYLKSLKMDGKLMFNDRIPYNSTVLATITRHQVGTVEKSLEIFKELGLIEILDNGSMYMLDIQNYIGKSSTEADRKREYRERIDIEKKKLIGQMSGHLSDKNPPEIEIEIDTEVDKDKEIEKDIEKRNKKNLTSVQTYFPNDEKLNSTFLDFMNMRKSLKNGKMTERAITMMINKLNKYDNDTAIAMLEQSILNNWKDVYELKGGNRSNEQARRVSEQPGGIEDLTPEQRKAFGIEL